MERSRALLTLALLVLALLATWGCSHGEGRRLLRQGELDQVLRVVRPVDAEAHVLRARALRRQGRLRAARTELLLGRNRDARSANVHLMLGFVELELGNEGAAVRSLSRALDLRSRQGCLRRTVAALLLRRGALRLRLWQEEEAGEDLRRAVELDPCHKARAAAIIAGRLGIPARECHGPPRAGLADDRPLPRRGRCSLEDAGFLLQRLGRRDLLLACRGAQLALRLEARGCVEQALIVWEALAREAPSDPRWPLQAARALLALQRPAKAGQLLQDHAYLARDRASALHAVARIWLLAGSKRRAARAAVDAVPFARSLVQQLTSIRLLREAGRLNQARKLARITVEARWPEVPPTRVRALVGEAISAAPRRRPRR